MYEEEEKNKKKIKKKHIRRLKKIKDEKKWLSRKLLKIGYTFELGYNHTYNITILQIKIK